MMESNAPLVTSKILCSPFRKVIVEYGAGIVGVLRVAKLPPEPPRLAGAATAKAPPPTYPKAQKLPSPRAYLI
jgi:hypothetical protein